MPAHKDEDKDELLNTRWFILGLAYPTRVATKFCVLFTISKILTVRSEEQVASRLP